MSQITTQRELRRLFWLEHQNVPGISRRHIRDHSGHGTMYQTDTRCAFADWLVALSRDGIVSRELAQRATLD